MIPYYEHQGITIYHGDCREVLPSLPKVDLVLTDPPYGCNYVAKLKTERTSTGRKAVKTCYAGEGVVGDQDSFDPSFLLGSGFNFILWGANYYADKLPPQASWLVWDKRGGRKEFYGIGTFADCEMAWCSDGKPARLFQLIWNGLIREGEDAGIPRIHPTQKPPELMRWCLARFPDAQTVLDPFVGSGTTLRAAKDLGRKAIGIEIEEKYCEIAAKRLSQEVLNFEVA